MAGQDRVIRSRSPPTTAWSRSLLLSQRAIQEQLTWQHNAVMDRLALLTGHMGRIESKLDSAVSDLNARVDQVYDLVAVSDGLKKSVDLNRNVAVELPALGLENKIFKEDLSPHSHKSTPLQSPKAMKYDGGRYSDSPVMSNGRSSMPDLRKESRVRKSKIRTLNLQGISPEMISRESTDMESAPSRLRGTTWTTKPPVAGSTTKSPSDPKNELVKLGYSFASAKRQFQTSGTYSTGNSRPATGQLSRPGTGVMQYHPATGSSQFNGKRATQKVATRKTSTPKVPASVSMSAMRRNIKGSRISVTGRPNSPIGRKARPNTPNKGRPTTPKGRRFSAARTNTLPRFKNNKPASEHQRRPSTGPGKMGGGKGPSRLARSRRMSLESLGTSNSAAMKRSHSNPRPRRSEDSAHIAGAVTPRNSRRSDASPLSRRGSAAGLGTASKRFTSKSRRGPGKKSGDTSFSSINNIYPDQGNQRDDQQSSTSPNSSLRGRHDRSNTSTSVSPNFARKKFYAAALAAGISTSRMGRSGSAPPAPPKSNGELLEREVQRLMEECEATWTMDKDFKVTIATWNCNSKRPRPGALQWLRAKPQGRRKKEVRPEFPHLYVVALQEMVSLRIRNMLLDSKSRVPAWLDSIHKAIDEGTEENTSYRLVLSKHLVGLLVAVFVRKDIKRFVREEQKAAVGCGRAGAGNKGAVGVRFRIFNTSFCFVNAHLAAHRENLLQRNADYRRVIDKLRFRPVSPTPMGTTSKTITKTRILDHDNVFFLGDLNYRLNLNDDKLWMVYSGISRKDWEMLLEYDQLNQIRQTGKAFENFSEGVVEFAPTFKYSPGTNDYATGDGKNRMPAWCDRILFKGKEGRISQSYYNNVDSELNSDHKPVLGSFIVKVRVPDPKKEAEQYERIMRVLNVRSRAPHNARRRLVSPMPYTSTSLPDTNEYNHSSGRLEQPDELYNDNAEDTEEDLKL
ncbi:hypothetical protein AAMO2058_000895500 [Amorphochlora amoebiformis]